MLNNFLSHFSSCIDSHDGMVNLFSILETNFLNFALQGLVASLLYVARCGYHVMNLSLAHGLLHIYSSAPQKPYQPPSSPCFPCGTCRYHPALENNQLQYSIPAAQKNCPFGQAHCNLIFSKGFEVDFDQLSWEVLVS